MRYLLALVLLAGCEKERRLPSGESARCVGINQQKDTALVYEYSARNIILGIVGVEVIVPPVLVLLNGFQCPTARRLNAPHTR
jgi:hypothetical protein